MRQTTIHGVEINQGDNCAYCHLNTAGQHEPGCPLHPHAIVWTPEGATLAKDYRGEYVAWRYIQGKGLVGRKYWSDGAGGVLTKTQADNARL